MSVDFSDLHAPLKAFAIKLGDHHRQNAAVKAVVLDFFKPNGLLDSRWKEFPKDEVHTIAAEPIESPSLRGILPPRPEKFTLCSADGSQIFSDRNFSIDFFLLNISQICLHIGTNDKPTLKSLAELYDIQAFAEAISDDSDQSDNPDDLFMTADKINALRQVKELEKLLLLSRHSKVDSRPLLALADGSLICWTLKNFKHLKQGYLKALIGFRTAKLPVASYISFTSNREVVKTIEELTAPELKSHRLSLAALNDRTLFEQHLTVGERSATFKSRSSILTTYPDEDKIYFFYLHTGREVARIEFPMWMYPNSIPMLHATIYDDLKKGSGYPMTLTEAHEQAVVKHAEQEQFFSLLQRLCEAEGYSAKYSAKTISKRTAKI
jgi:hypothetical protein